MNDDLKRDERHIIMLAAWLNVEPSQVPDRPGYTTFVSTEYKEAWERVYDAAVAHAGQGRSYYSEMLDGPLPSSPHAPSS